MGMASVPSSPHSWVGGAGIGMPNAEYGKSQLCRSENSLKVTYNSALTRIVVQRLSGSWEQSRDGEGDTAGLV